MRAKEIRQSDVAMPFAPSFPWSGLQPCTIVVRMGKYKHGRSIAVHSTAVAAVTIVIASVLADRSSLPAPTAAQAIMR